MDKNANKLQHSLISLGKIRISIDGNYFKNAINFDDFDETQLKESTFYVAFFIYC